MCPKQKTWCLMEEETPLVPLTIAGEVVEGVKASSFFFFLFAPPFPVT